MTGNTTEAQLVELLHLPPGRQRPEPADPDQQGGPLLAVVGAVFALIGVLLWVLRPDPTLTWTAVGLVGLGAVQLTAGVLLAAHRRRHGS